jgi:hypothetical protein
MKRRFGSEEKFMRRPCPSEDSFQLVVGQAYRVQEAIPARIPVEVLKEGIFLHADQARVALPARALQPFESSVLVPAIRMNFGDLVSGYIGKGVG